MKFRTCPLLALVLAPALAFASPTTPPAQEIIISVKKQKMTVLQSSGRKAEFPISTSKFGVGDERRSFRTPLGAFEIVRKVGANLPLGAVFKGLHFTGEVVAANAPGRDPIVTRVLCLGGGSAGSRGIYIHGTPQEKLIGRPASYGCIRMRSRDVVALFDNVGIGTRVLITDAPAAQLASAAGNAHAAPFVTDAHGTEYLR